jgi:hypothetical protein
MGSWATAMKSVRGNQQAAAYHYHVPHSFQGFRAGTRTMLAGNTKNDMVREFWLGMLWESDVLGQQQGHGSRCCQSQFICIITITTYFLSPTIRFINMSVEISVAYPSTKVLRRHRDTKRNLTTNSVQFNFTDVACVNTMRRTFGRVQERR